MRIFQQKIALTGLGALIIGFLLFSCNDPAPPGSNDMGCESPESVGLDTFFLGSGGEDVFVFIWNSVVNAGGYHFTLTVNSDETPLVDVTGIPDTTFTVSDFFNVGDTLHVTVSAICINGISPPTIFDIINMNGGATLDDVPSRTGRKGWLSICNRSCDYVRFPDEKIRTCTPGVIIKLPLSKWGKSTGFDRLEVCEYLQPNDPALFCERIQTIDTILTKAHAKRMWLTCIVNE